jgi:hypothetical protein
MLNLMRFLLPAVVALAGCAAAPIKEARYSITLHADPLFNDDTRTCIAAANEEWEERTEGLAHADIVYDYSTGADQAFTLRALSSEHQQVRKEDESNGKVILGHVDGWHVKGRADVYIVTDRIFTAKSCRKVVMHELGHLWMGAGHVENNADAVMTKSMGFGSADCLKGDDLRMFCSRNQCNGLILKGCDEE